MSNQPTRKLNWREKLDAAAREERAIARARRKAARHDTAPTRNVVCDPGCDERRGGQYSNHYHTTSGLYRGLLTL